MADEQDVEQHEVEQEQEQPVLFYARALYSYQAVEEGEFDFNESDVVSVIEDYSDGWWRAYTQNSIGKVPANYFEVLPDNTEAGAEATGEEGYNYEYDAGGYEYNDGGGTDDQTQPADTDSPPPSSTPSSPPPPSSNQHPPISESAAYIEQMKCWGDILQSQKDEKAKLEKQAAEAEEQLVVQRKAAFYYQQLDYMLHEVLKLMTEMDLDLDASVLYQRAQLAIIRDIKAIKDTADSVKLEVHVKRHLDEKIDELNTKLNNSMQLLENCDKTRKTFYTDLYSLQNFLEEVETRRKVEEEERRRLEEEERRRQEAEDAEWE